MSSGEDLPEQDQEQEGSTDEQQVATPIDRVSFALQDRRLASAQQDSTNPATARQLELGDEQTDPDPQPGQASQEEEEEASEEAKEETNEQDNMANVTVNTVKAAVTNSACRRIMRVRYTASTASV